MTTPLRFLPSILLAGAFLLPGPAAALQTDGWDRVLRTHAHRGGVDYRSLMADGSAMRELAGFLDSVERMDADAPLDAWLNAYNALVVKTITEHYPLRSVRDVPGFFDRIVHRVAGRSLTLDEIEHEIIRPRFRDARVHFALNCGARSCPALHRRAFRGADLDATLDRLSRRAVADPRHTRVTGGALSASEIFRWFRDDFERDGGSVLGWIRQYDVGGRTESVPAGAEVGALPYDWRLNDHRRR